MARKLSRAHKGYGSQARDAGRHFRGAQEERRQHAQPLDRPRLLLYEPPHDDACHNLHPHAEGQGRLLLTSGRVPSIESVCDCSNVL